MSPAGSINHHFWSVRIPRGEAATQRPAEEPEDEKLQPEGMHFPGLIVDDVNHSQRWWGACLRVSALFSNDWCCGKYAAIIMFALFLSQLVDARQREIEGLEEAVALLQAQILHSKRSGDDLYLLGDMHDMEFPYGILFYEVQIRTGLLAGQRRDPEWVTAARYQASASVFRHIFRAVSNIYRYIHIDRVEVI